MDTFFWPTHLEREKILTTMAEAANIPLMLIIAPMGYGKTTITHRFFEQNPEYKPFWLLFNQDEMDDIWLWQRICERFKIEGYTIWKQMIELGLPKTKQQIIYLIQIVKKLIKRPFYIILDNYHECNSPYLNSLLESLVYEKIPNLHFICVSRTYPDISYDEMWLKGYCFLLEQGMFTLTNQEIKQFFSINNISVTENELNYISKFTEGWMSAVYLILLNYKRTGHLQDVHNISHLMKASVYDKLPDNIKEFFIKMSLFDNFTAEQACYITECEFSPDFLYTFTSQIGFVKFNITHGTYQLHTLFKLVVRVELDKSGIDKDYLYNRCAQWYENNKKFIHAIQYYQKIGNNEACFKILTQESSCILYEQAPLIISDFFTNTSIEERMRHEKAYLTYIYALIIIEQSKKGYELFSEAKEYYSRYSQNTDYSKILGELLIIEAFTNFNNLETMTECYKNAYELLNKCSHIFDSQLLFTHGTPDTLPLYHNKVGNLRKIVELEKEYTYYYMRLINDIDGSWDTLFESEYQLVIGNIQEAEQLAELACEKSKFRKQLCVIISSYFLLLRCDIYLGRKSLFEKHILEFEGLFKNEIRPFLKMDYDLAIGYIYGVLRQTDKIAEWIQAFDLKNCNTIVRSVRSGCIVYGFTLIHNHQWIKLKVLGEEMHLPYSSSTHIYVIIYSDIYQSIAAYHLKNIEQALHFMKKAIELAEPDRMIMPFIEYSIELLPILKELSCQSSYAKILLTQCNIYIKGLTVFFDDAIPVELTKREQELMHLVIKGYKNYEIGEQLGIALVTVEKTLTNIYRKLHVSNRYAAISKLREFNF